MSLRILSLFVRYGDADYKGAYQALMDFYAGMPEVSVESVLIDTALAHDVKAWIGRRTLMLAGDNRRREFSGWDTAIEHCRKRFADFDLVHLVTSAFQNEYNGFYPLICREMLDYVQATPQVMLAHVDAYPERVRLYGRSFQTWGCSKFLFARPADILALGSLVGPFDEPDFFPAGRTEPFNADAPLSENYARFLLDWLTGSGLPHGQWHSVFRYADENVQKFRAKALSILDEHNLSLRIRESGVRIVDYTWWHANRHRIGDLVPPDELIQVQERNRYLFGSPIVEGQALRQAPFPQKAGIAALLEDEDDELFTGGLGRALLAGVAMPHELTPAGACIARAGMLIKVGYRFSARQLKWLAEVSEELVQDAPLPITRGLHAVWLARDDLHRSLNLDTAEGREALVVWWSRQHREEVDLCVLMPERVLGEPAATLEQDAPLPLTRGLHAEWLSRPDLRQALDLGSAEGRKALVVWWVRENTQDAGLRSLIPESALSEPDARLEQDAPLPLTRGLHAMWLARDDLQQSMDLGTAEGRRALVAWWSRERRNDPALRALIAESVLSEPDARLEQDAPLPLTRGLHAEWLAREDLQRVFDLAAKAGREALSVWWYVTHRDDAFIRELVRLEVMEEVMPLLVQDEGRPITRAEYLLWISREDLRVAFDVKQRVGRKAYSEWLLGYGAGESTVQGERDAASSPTVSSGPTKGAGFAEGGVNVIGYGRGEFGIGEDVRMAVRALSCIDIGTCVPRIPLRVAARQEDVSLRAYEVPRPLFRTNLICMPHYETLRLLAATGHSILDERYNIGFWQWELPRFPAPMRCALDLVDEIWSASSFTAEAMRAVTDKPVIRMPMVVTLPAPERKWSRSDFGLNEGEFIFLTVLDGNSSLKRKNPLAAVRAFTAAFPKSKHVRLVVKAMNVSEAQLEWRSVVEHAARDDRISLIVETMTKDKLLGLQSVCDCFVSLHRSEGFGRNIAEAMLLGKPVIVSDYSGNRDFSNETTAFLVQGRTIPLAQGDYAFGEGQVWFDPDVGAAAEAFHRCLDQAESRMSIAAAGRAFVHARYSPEAVGAAYAKRLAHVNAS